ncbi:MAG: [Fe-Fe] hydrogenase large subunit C-terminal domain-containing protein [Christensenellales bacterium]|jgi:Na+-translocating ferredoxin:NAD+ oxidoreductase RNF subunit RnfB
MLHSVTLDVSKCRGCTNCVKHCPTEAIRVRGGRARILNERCIDCGECVRICPYHAKVAVTDPLSVINDYPYKIALPAPSLYGQFAGASDIRKILSGLLSMGFDDVFEVARGAEIVSYAVGKRLQKPHKKPLISSACPAVLRLIQVRFPTLVDHVIDVEAPMEMAAQMARDGFCERHGADPRDVGVFFISPCAAKNTSVKSPLGNEKSHVSGVISMADIYGPLAALLSKGAFTGAYQGPLARRCGVRWANSGGEADALRVPSALAVDGIHNVIRILEEIEDGRLRDLDFFEGLACVGGCVGGPLTLENSFIARGRIKALSGDLSAEPLKGGEFDALLERYPADLRLPLQPRPVMKLDDDLAVAMAKMRRIDEITENLPGLDCGACGSPSCRTHAEDIVQGYANEQDCLIRLRERLLQIAQEMAVLSHTTTMDLGKREDEQ